MVSVTVADNGPGLRAGFGTGPDAGFGVSLVRALAEQLDGTMRFENDGGTRAVLEFPDPA